jgi:hypothetical protein
MSHLMNGMVYPAMTADARWIRKAPIIVIPAKMSSASAVPRIAIPAMRPSVLAAAQSAPIVVSLSAINA